MQYDNRDCPCSERLVGVEGPVRAHTRISPEILELLNQAPIPSEFLQSLREFEKHAGELPAPELEAVLTDGPTPALGVPAWEMPLQPDAMFAPATRMSRVETVSSNKCSTAFYLPDLTLDLSGAMLTPGLRDWVGLRLNGLVWNTLLCEEAADSECDISFELRQIGAGERRTLKAVDPTLTDAQIQQFDTLIRVEHDHDHPIHKATMSDFSIQAGQIPQTSADGRTAYYRIVQLTKDTIFYVYVNRRAIERDFGSNIFTVKTSHSGHKKSGLPFRNSESRRYGFF